MTVAWAISQGGSTPAPALFSTLQALVHAHTGLEPRDQHILYGDAAYPIRDDADVEALLVPARDPEDGSSPATSASQQAFISVLPASILRASIQDGCSRIYFGECAVVQPCYVIPGSEQGVCETCQALCFPEGLLLAKVGAPMEPFVCGAPALCAEGLGAYIFKERLHEANAICGGEGEKEGKGTRTLQAEESRTPGATTREAFMLSPPALALLATFRQAAYVQQALGFDQHSREAAEMMGRLQSGRSTILAYQAPALKNKALSTIPVAALHARAMMTGSDPQRNPLHFQDALLRELLAWFKHDFFSWVNNPPCERCGATDTTLLGGAAPTPAESAGKAGRVEVYNCKSCQAQTRFPRYNDPGVLLATRRGRCGEWANCFTLCCVALGYEARYVMDWTDHVWTEVWSPLEGRYLHLDSCENAADTPLMYEGGWGKKLSYVVAFGKDHCVDVTRRYTRTFETQLLSRRQSVPELVLAQQVAALNQQLRNNSNSGPSVQERALREQFELHSHTVLGEASQLVHLKAGELRGRISGNAAWKRARGEDGVGDPGRELECGGAETPCASSLAATCGVHPAQVEGEANEPMIEREEMAGLPLWPYVAGGGSLLVSATSIGSLKGESLTLLGSYGGFGPEAVTINGLPVAVGRRGLNVVVLDLVRSIIEQSVAFDVPEDENGDADDNYAGSVAVAFLHEKLAQGKVVVAVILGSGAHALCQAGVDLWKDALGSPRKTPGRSEPWLVITGGATAAWATAETRAAGQGPLKAIVTMPLSTSHPSLTSTPSNNVKVLHDAIAAVPIVHSMGAQGDGVLSVPPLEAYQAMRAAFPQASLAGFSYKAGCGLVGMARTSGLRGGSGWRTHQESSPMSASEADGLKVRIENMFTDLVAEGMTPNMAALQALSQIKETQLQERQQASASATRFTVVYGPLVGTSVRPPLSETMHVFDDSEVATPAQAMAEWQESFPLQRLRSVRVWTSPRGVLGLQAGYQPQGSIDAPIYWAPVHHPLSKLPSSAFFHEKVTGTLVLGPEEGLTMLGIQTSDTCILGVNFTTTAQRSVSFGLAALSGTVTTNLPVPHGMELAAFHGTLGGGGMQRLGIVTRRQGSKSPGILSLPADAWGIYTACPVDRASRQLLYWSGGERIKVVAALRAARRYLENCLKDPSNTTYRLIRVRSKFFLDNIGSLPGSGSLMQALGFEHVAAIAPVAAATEGKKPDEEACYMLPLPHVAPSTLQYSVERLDINLTRMMAETNSTTGV
eukprot:evm.model.NODE_43026_length_43751_cov_20.433773.2